MNKMMKKMTASLLLAAMLLLTVPFAASAAEDPAVFDEENIVFSFGEVSDVHIKNSASNTDTDASKFESALRQLDAEARKTNGDHGLDAVLSPGDVINSGGYGGVYGQMANVKTIYERVFSPVEVPFVYAPGNHDVSWASNSASQVATLNAYLGDDYFLTDQDMTALTNDGNRHCVIDGFHVISLVPVTGNPVTYSSATKTWLDATLASITAENPNRFVFILNHPMIKDTVYGSDLGTSWYTSDLTSILSKYPQVVIFGGHLHFPLNDPRSIMQTDFTSVGSGSVSYMAIESGGYEDMASATTMNDRYDISSGNLVQIDGNGNMRIRRMDFANGKIIGEDWTVSHPTADRSHLQKYTTARGNAANNSAPVMSDIAIQLGGADIGFTQPAKVRFAAGTDDKFVHHYVIEYGPKLGAKETKKILADFYRHADPSDMRDEYLRSLGEFEVGTTYEISVTAYDSWGAVSNTVTTEITGNGTPTSTVVPSVYADLDIVDGQLTDTKNHVTVTNHGGVCENRDVIIGGRTVNVPTFNVTASGDYALCTFKYLTSTEDVKIFAESGFSVEAFYVMPQKGGTQGIVCGTQGGGWGLAELDGQPYYLTGAVGDSYNPYVYSDVDASETNLIHVVGVYNYIGDQQAIYVNGVKMAFEDIRSEFLCGGGSSYNKFCIGSDIKNTGLGGDFPSPEMTLVDAKIYEGALSDALVMAAYEEALKLVYSKLSVDITLSDDIKLNLYADHVPVDAVMRFTINGVTTQVNGIPSGSEYKYTLGVTPQCMGDTVKAELISGGKIIGEKTLTILEYLTALQNATAEELEYTPQQKEKLDTLIRDLLIYGGAAQRYTGHNDDQLVSDGVGAGTSFTLDSTDKNLEKNGVLGSFSYATVIFDSMIKLRVVATAEGAPAVRCYRLPVGGGERVLVDTFSQAEGVYTMDIPMKATGFDDVYVFTFTDGISEGATMIYSVRSYVYAMKARTDKMGRLANALYAYGLSANAYDTAIRGS